MFIFDLVFKNLVSNDYFTASQAFYNGPIDTETGEASISHIQIGPYILDWPLDESKWEVLGTRNSFKVKATNE